MVKFERLKVLKRPRELVETRMVFLPDPRAVYDASLAVTRHGPLWG